VFRKRSHFLVDRTQCFHRQYFQHHRLHRMKSLDEDKDKMRMIE
jgi:hypothetical protein